MRRLLLAGFAVLLAGTACGARAADAAQNVEASMVVTGTIGVSPQGSVIAFALDQPEKLPPAVASLIGTNVPRWTFQPVLQGGKPVTAKSHMSLRVIARSMGGGKFQLALVSAYFGDASDSIQIVQRMAPNYPNAAARARVDGTVYVLLRIDRTGNVADAVARQVDLLQLGGEAELEHWRSLFAQASTKALRRWTFTPATATDHEPYRVVMVPVAYRVRQELPESATYGQWQTYVPGPLEPAPWFDKDQMLTSGGDALPGDGIYGPSSLSLLTPLDHG